jgi:NADPH:quinone reductase
MIADAMMIAVRAVIITRPGDPSVLEIRDVPEPTLPSAALMVRVRASGLNRADLLQRRGLHPPPPGVNPLIPGLELAGDVEGSSDPFGPFREGDRVMGLLAGEACAEKAVLPVSTAMPVPVGLDYHEAAAVPEVFLTAYDALFSQLRVLPGETLLIHAVGSGVGTAALQLAKLSGLVTIGTVRSPEKLEKALRLGLDFGVCSTHAGWREEVRRCVEGRGVHAVLDLVGAGLWEDTLDLLAEKGRMLVVGLVSGSRVAADLGLILRKRLSVCGTALRSRPAFEKASLVREFGERILPLFSTGRIRPVLDRVFPYDDVVAAHRYLEENRSFGKVVLSW